MNEFLEQYCYFSTGMIVGLLVVGVNRWWILPISLVIGVTGVRVTRRVYGSRNHE
jgi:hypothetical protein